MLKLGTLLAIGDRRQQTLNRYPNLMTSSYQETANELLLGLEAFDSVIGPEGLYAAEERDPSQPAFRWQLEWERCLMPCIGKAGAVCAGDGGFRENWRHSFSDWRRRNRPPGIASANFRFPGGSEISIDMVKISKIKVRKYGDTYRIDPHFDFEDRWESLRLGSYLRHYRPKRSSPRFLLVVGFDSHNDPFQHELTHLKDECSWHTLDWAMITHSWQDPHHRGFNTRAAIWFPSQPLENQTP